MPASRSSPPNRRVTPTDTECPVCHKVINRAADLKRHMKNHDPNAEKFRCPEPGCEYSSLQKSNLKTHSNQHNNEKPHKCPDCDFKTSDPGALTRHRERRHEYDPFGRRAAKRQAKQAEEYKGFKPYKKPRASTRRNGPAPDAPVAGPSNHATALETPPIATLEQWTEGTSSDSSDAESVKTDQFYPSSVSSEGSSSPRPPLNRFPSSNSRATPNSQA
ncbi:hypothetical protein FA13DRAFT_1734465 [Coprinellus micaceus]|uniref:C2H2-type domain-containing protein n=1 Tax=Coprinellus micaceus TaxID=71717 RepID=A0A4Y7T7V1_COPMI|nr:hypothetical protein FA13DRAFT_1734465 [Coprinellus micaceus]